MRLNRRAMIAGLAAATWAAHSAARSLVQFEAADGVRISGHSFGSGRRAALLVPGAHGVGETWSVQARRLAEDGFRVLAMDYRGLGNDAAGSPDGDKAHLDVLGAVQRLRAEGARQISVVGASWGGWAAGTVAAEHPGLIDRLILLAHSPIDHPERLSGRKLFIVAAGDRSGSGRPRLESIRQQYERAPQPKQLVVLDGAAHAQFLFLTPQGERLYAEILRFLSER